MGDRLGRIDDPRGGVQLLAHVDEYHLPRWQKGQRAFSSVGVLHLAQTLPQLQGGKLRMLLRWPADANAATAAAQLRPVQAVDPALAAQQTWLTLLLPEGPGVQAQRYVREGPAL